MLHLQTSDNGSIASATSYDPFHLNAPVQSNPYQDTNSLSGATFFQGPSTFQQPVSHETPWFGKFQELT